MTSKVLFSAIAATVGLLGCAGAGTKYASPCNNGVCKVAVTITDCGTKGGVAVNPDPISVPGANNIEWDIATPGYSFPQNGIEIKDFYGQFGSPQLNPTGSKITIHNKNTNKVPVYYAVNVMRGATPCVPLDPWIYNE